MRLLNGLAFAGLAGLATAATNEPAQVYILSSNPSTSSSSSIPQIPRQVARQILLQRVNGQTQLDDLPESITEDEALSYIAQYGKSPMPLFGDASSSGSIAPSQLAVVLEGIPDDFISKIPEFMKAQDFNLAFTVLDAPSSKAHEHLVDAELADISASCDLTSAIDPYDSCWNGRMSLAVKYDVSGDMSAINHLIENLSALRKAVSSNIVEATIVVLPQSTRKSKHAYWTTNAPSELRRRALSEESPIIDASAKVVVSPASGGAVSEAATASEKFNLGCFSTYNTCVSSTNNCTGHGICADKYAVPGQPSGDKQCFVCSCLSTLADPSANSTQHTHWGGAYCQKIDVSSPFWLLFGTSIILVGVVAGSIGLLFSVGEEKLPGVIGAGVSRSK